jgi:hypothetical protein
MGKKKRKTESKSHSGGAGQMVKMQTSIFSEE